jgi:hypothetical protein
MFDPKGHKPDPNKTSGGFTNSTIPGICAMVIYKVFQRDRSKSGKPFVKLHFKQLAGPQPGSTFIDAIFLSNESLWKLGNLCAAVGHEDQFDPKSDAELLKAIGRKPFIAKLDVESSGDQKYGRLGYIATDPRAAREEHPILAEAMDRYAAEQFEKQSASGEDYDPFAPEERRPRGNDQHQAGFFDDAPPPEDEWSGGGSKKSDDDNIPF